MNTDFNFLLFPKILHSALRILRWNGSGPSDFGVRPSKRALFPVFSCKCDFFASLRLCVETRSVNSCSFVQFVSQKKIRWNRLEYAGLSWKFAAQCLHVADIAYRSKYFLCANTCNYVTGREISCNLIRLTGVDK